jgi:hypothetical protein
MKNEDQSREHAHHFIDTKGTVHKEFILQNPIVNSAYYCNVLQRLREDVRRLRAKLWRQNNWLLHHDKASPHTFSPRSFLPRKHDCRPSPILLFSVSPIEDKTKRPPF